MNKSKWATATDTVPEPCQILWTYLRPFCLGHHLLFKTFALPFAGNPLADCGHADILIGVFICSLSYEAALEMLHNDTWHKAFARWKKNLRGPWWKRRQPNLDESEILFRAYLQDGYSMPPVWRRAHDNNTISMSQPWESLLLHRLMIGGFSKTEVANGYLPAQWYSYFALLEIRQAENCTDPKSFHRIFYTREEWELEHPEGDEPESKEPQ